MIFLRKQPRTGRMFKSGLTRELFKSFLKSHQQNKSLLDHTPFLYVDLDSQSMIYVAYVMKTLEVNEEIVAFSVYGKGNVEVLTTNVAF